MRALLCVVTLVLAGCAASGDMRKAQQPVSQQPVVNEAGTRAKNRVELASAYYQDKQLAIALQEVRKAIAADSGYAPAQNLLALIYTDLGEKQLAEIAFERALQLAPADPEVSNNYGWFLCQQGREREALGYFQTALANPLYPAPSIALVNAGVCSERLRDDKGAEDYLLRALQLDPANVRALYELAQLEYRTGRYGEARMHTAEFHRYRESSPQSLWLAFNIARKAGNRGDEARFRAQLQQKFPGSAEVQKLLQGQYE